MDGLPLKRARSELDPKKCVICQTTTTQPTSSTEDGRKRIIEAANIRGGVVAERLTNLSPDQIHYHVSNDCYKNYTHKRSLERIKQIQSASSAQSTTSEDIPGTHKKVTRRSRSIATPKSIHRTFDYRTKCVVCGQIKIKGDLYKYRICEMDRAQKFLEAAVYFQDDVYVRTCNLQDVHAVFGADLYCHKNCIRKYIKNYEDLKVESSPQRETPSEKQHAFTELLIEIEPNLQNGNAYVLSDIREKANSKLSQTNDAFSNKELKVLLYNHFGQNVRFSIPQEVNKSAMVFLNNISTEDVVDQLRSAEPVTKCAKILRESLLNTDFQLNDKFCDASDLEQSWSNTLIPECVLTFFGTLFNVDATTFYEPNVNLELNEDEEDDIPSQVTKLTNTKRRKVEALFQIMFYNVHNGSKRTPLHVMNAQSVHEVCKSKTLVTSLNHYGLSISYPELLKYHNDMAGYIVKANEGHVPIPSHFDKSMNTIGAFDNFDHEEATLSGINGSHDTVSVLFQDRPNTSIRKPNISDSAICHGTKVLKDQLPCQTLLDFIKPARKPSLPEEYTVSEELYSMDTCTLERIKLYDIAWSLARMDLSHIHEGILTPCPDKQCMPSWSAFNSVISDESLDKKIVGFLPVVPYPVTDYATVYTTLKNFQDIVNQLDQQNIAVTCDEGVYHIAREIQMLHPVEFSNIVLCLGSFHMSKIYLGCIGKYLRNSGAESIWTESSVFGLNVVQSVISGTHYVRSFKGMLLLCEVMERLQWLEFLNTADNIGEYQEELTLLKDLKTCVTERNSPRSREILESFVAASGGMAEEFKTFREENGAKFETFRYWDTFIAMVTLLKQLVRADREGNWTLHLNSVQSILPLFAQFDCINYLRWCSVYLEDMRKLPETAPEVYDNFLAGKFVVKRTSGSFKAVGADQCLEQTINRSQKSSGGIIGKTKQKDFVTEWELIYHEMMAVSSLHRELSGSNPSVSDMNVHHEFTQSTTKAREACVHDMMSYVQKYENPFHITAGTEKKLHNIITQEMMTEEIRNDILNVNENGEKHYIEFRQQRIVSKSKRLSDTIHRNNTKTFQSISSTKLTTATKKASKKSSAAGHRLLEVAQSRGYDIKELLKYDLTPNSYLFDSDGLMSKPTKSALCHELEKTLANETIQEPSRWTATSTAYVVDVMANVRKVKTKDLKTFGDFCAAFVNLVLIMCKRGERIDFVFDSYLEGSIKDSERRRRANRIPIDLNTIEEQTLLPVDMNTFWPSMGNKIKLQALLRKWIRSKSRMLFPSVKIVISGIISPQLPEPCQSVDNGFIVNIEELDMEIEEADERIIPHVLHAAKLGAKRIVILSNDTDVLVLTLYFWNRFKAHGLEEMWFRAGVADSTRFIPLHMLASKNANLCSVLPALHSLTGCDSTSKFGTKLSALKADPARHLVNFGSNLNDPKEDDILAEAEQYLVKVIKPSTDCATMDELRYSIYVHGKAVDLSDLPPSSRATRGHLKRAMYTTYIQIHCLDSSMHDTDPCLYGYEMGDDNLMMPINYCQSYPEDLALSCNCKQCSTKRCICRINEVPCCMYCKCREEMSNGQCKNPCVTITVPVML